MKDDFHQSLEPYIMAALGKKARGLAVLDVRKLTSIADAFLICSGRSNRQVTSIGEHIKKTLKNHKIKPLSVEGIKEGHWILLDYGHIIIHVFYEPIRSFYDLDGLWVDARKVNIDHFLNHMQNDDSQETESFHEK